MGSGCCCCAAAGGGVSAGVAVCSELKRAWLASNTAPCPVPPSALAPLLCWLPSSSVPFLYRYFVPANTTTPLPQATSRTFCKVVPCARRRYLGFPTLGIQWKRTESPALRAFTGMGPEQTGKGCRVWDRVTF